MYVTKRMPRTEDCVANAAIQRLIVALKINPFPRNVDGIGQPLRDIDRYHCHERIKLELKGPSLVKYQIQAFRSEHTSSSFMGLFNMPGYCLHNR